jgi:hypothetical protein
VREGDDGEIEHGATSELASADVAMAYVASVEGSHQGVTFDPRQRGIVVRPAPRVQISRWHVLSCEVTPRGHDW